LRTLSLSPKILIGIESKKASRFIEDLCGMKSLEGVDFAWNEEEGSKLVAVRIEKDFVSGEMKVVSSSSEE